MRNEQRVLRKVEPFKQAEVVEPVLPEEVVFCYSKTVSL